MEKFCVQGDLTDANPNAEEYCFDKIEDAEDKFDRLVKDQPSRRWRIAQWIPETLDFRVSAEHFPGGHGVPTRTRRNMKEN